MMLSKNILALLTASLLIAFLPQGNEAGLLGDLGDDIGSLLGGLMNDADYVVNDVAGAVDDVGGLLEDLINGVVGGAAGIVKLILNVLGGALSTLGGIESFLMEIFDGNKDLVQEVLDYSGVPVYELSPQDVLDSILGVFNVNSITELPTPIRKRIATVVIRRICRNKNQVQVYY